MTPHLSKIPLWVLGAILAWELGHGVSSATIVTDSSWGRSSQTLQMGIGQTYSISSDLGRIQGGNLFHSFQTFNLAAGQKAAFDGPSGIANVLTRVTGGTASTINGTLRCSIPGANFYFINPSGVVFGPNAKVDVGGVFAATTADYIVFPDDNNFQARVPDGAVLSVAAPSAFGFLPPESGKSISSVHFNGTSLLPANYKGITVVAGAVLVDNGAKLTPREGDVHVTAVNSAGELPLSDWNTASFARLGSVTLDNGSISTIAGGNIRVEAETLEILNGGNIQTSTSSTATGGDVTVIARSVTIDSPFKGIKTDSMDSGAAGDIRVEASDIFLRNYGIISSDSTLVSANSGSVSVTAQGTLELRAKGRISSTANLGGSGTITITAGTLNLLDGGFVTGTARGTEPIGPIRVYADTINIDAMGKIPTGIGSIPWDSSVRAGDVEIQGRDIFIRNLGMITSSGFGASRGGGVNIAVENELISDFGLIETSSYGDADAGTVQIHANKLSMNHQATIDSVAYGSGTGGHVMVDTADVTMGTQSRISSSADANGNAGSVVIGSTKPVTSLSVSDGSVISSSAVNGNAGSVTINSANWIHVDSSRITVESQWANAGAVTLKAPHEILLRNSDVSATAFLNGGNINIDPLIFGLDHSTLTANAEQGNGGHINLRAAFVYSLGLSLDDAVTARSQSQSAQQGTVLIQSGIDFTSSLLGLPDGLITEANQLKEGCARKNPRANSFIVRGMGGLPPTPDALCPNYNSSPVEKSAN